MIRSSLLIVIAAIVVCAGANQALSATVSVALNRSPVSVSETTVRVGHVATVTGGSASDRRYIEQLDLESLKETDGCEITQKQIQMRLMLAGYKRYSFHVTGPNATSALRSTPLLVRGKMERLIEKELGRLFGVGTDRISVRLTSDSQLSSIGKSLSASEFSIRVVPRNDFPIGPARLTVDVIDGRGMRVTRSLDVQVSLSMKIAVADKPIARGTVVTPDMIRTVDRAVTSNTDYANPEEVVGRQAGRYIASNSIVLANHLMVSRQGNSQVVKRNDLLDVVIKIGSGEIRLKNARAMEPGSIGETIEILNPQTNKRFNASIVGPNLATLLPITRRF